jgi:tubulin delta
MERENALTAKSILVDMEAKVVNKCLERHGGGASSQCAWRYSPELAFFKQEGSGNNWAYGYNAHGSACKEKILERLRRLLE